MVNQPLSYHNKVSINDLPFVFETGLMLLVTELSTNYQRQFTHRAGHRSLTSLLSGICYNNAALNCYGA